MQGTWVWSLVQKLDPTGLGATKPVSNSSWATVPQPEGPYDATKIPHAATKTRQGQINTFKNKKTGQVQTVRYIVLVRLWINSTAALAGSLRAQNLYGGVTCVRDQHHKSTCSPPSTPASGKWMDTGPWPCVDWCIQNASAVSASAKCKTPYISIDRELAK